MEFPAARGLEATALVSVHFTVGYSIFCRVVSYIAVYYSRVYGLGVSVEDLGFRVMVYPFGVRL